MRLRITRFPLSTPTKVWPGIIPPKRAKNAWSAKLKNTSGGLIVVDDEKCAPGMCKNEIAYFADAVMTMMSKQLALTDMYRKGYNDPYDRSKSRLTFISDDRYLALEATWKDGQMIVCAYPAKYRRDNLKPAEAVPSWILVVLVDGQLVIVHSYPATEEGLVGAQRLMRGLCETDWAAWRGFTAAKQNKMLNTLEIVYKNKRLTIKRTC